MLEAARQVRGQHPDPAVGPQSGRLVLGWGGADEGVSKESDIAIRRAERASQRLVFQYARLVDSGQAAQVADLFTEDGVWTGADGRSMNGRAEILAAFSGRQALSRRTSRHVMTNVQIDMDGEDAATGIAYLI